MAIRPVFFVCDNSNDKLIQEDLISFQWFPGLSVSQKQKNIVALHNVAKDRGIDPILEVSTKSESVLGRSLSAFNLKINCPGKFRLSLESVFQGSKIFERGGPYTDLYGQDGFVIKKDERLRHSGEIIGFDFFGERISNEPKTAFYDWLYIKAVHNIKGIWDQVNAYNGFTDIEFNSKKSLNCQARSLSLYVAFGRRGVLQKVLEDRHLFWRILEKQNKIVVGIEQLDLFNRESYNADGHLPNS